jgi:hypothetical protein
MISVVSTRIASAMLSTTTFSNTIIATMGTMVTVYTLTLTKTWTSARAILLSVYSSFRTIAFPLQVPSYGSLLRDICTQVNVNRAFLHKCSEKNSSVLLKGNLAVNVGAGLTVLSAGAGSVIESNVVAGYKDAAFQVTGNFAPSRNEGINSSSFVQWNTSANFLPGVILSSTSRLLSKFPDLHPFPLEMVRNTFLSEFSVM